jgi:hypothetical protein
MRGKKNLFQQLFSWVEKSQKLLNDKIRLKQYSEWSRQEQALNVGADVNALRQKAEVTALRLNIVFTPFSAWTGWFRNCAGAPKCKQTASRGPCFLLF